LMAQGQRGKSFATDWKIDIHPQHQ